MELKEVCMGHQAGEKEGHHVPNAGVSKLWLFSWGLGRGHTRESSVSFEDFKRAIRSHQFHT